MKTLRTIFVLIFLGACQNVQEPKPIISTKDSLCQKWVANAVSDFQHNRLRYGRERINTKIQDSLLLSQYSITGYLDTNWGDFDNINCYYRAIDSLLSLKYKRDVLRDVLFESQEIEFYNQTGMVADKLSVIDLSDNAQENYLSCFLQYDTTISRQKWNEVRSNVKTIITNEKVSIENLPLKIEYDTNGLVVAIHSKKQIKVATKNKIIAELNRYRSNIIFEMNGKKKNVLLPFNLN